MEEDEKDVDQKFIQVALQTAHGSLDPSTKVGSVIVKRGKYGEWYEVARGCNSFPYGVANTPERWNDREKKLELVVHAEMNAVLAATRIGISLSGARMYVIATDTKTGAIWGGPPCLRCSVEVIQSGIFEIVAPSFKNVPSRWLDSIQKALVILEETGIAYREIELPSVDLRATEKAESVTLQRSLPELSYFAEAWRKV